MHPLVYEINTRCWLWELSEHLSTRVTLGNVPESEFARWRQLGFTHLWLMGVWSIGPRTQSFSRNLPELRASAAKLLPNFTEDDIVGSPYAIAGYQVSETLGGEAGLAEFRQRLIAHKLKLILDFIPNHVGLDHPWLESAPGLFVQSPSRRPGTFRQHTENGPLWIAHGKDPYFPAWTDTAQLDYRNPATRTAMIENLRAVSRLCDGVRCDMTMLVLNEVFARNWSRFPRPPAERGRPSVRRTSENGKAELTKPLRSGNRPPPSEFWAEAIPTIKAVQPDFLFLAEAYWDLEPRLLELGFDFAYDKRLTDHLIARRPAEVQHHLLSSDSGRPAGDRAHFLENHDEPRAASVLSMDEHRAAAMLTLSLPGMRLLHQGQLTGATRRASVHLRRFPEESPQPEIAALYELLLTTLQKSAVGHGVAELLEPSPAWDGNPTANNLIVVLWQSIPEEFDLAAINLAPHSSQCYVKLTIANLADHDWQMADRLGEARYERSGSALCESGLYLDLPAHAPQLFHFTRR